MNTAKQFPLDLTKLSTQRPHRGPCLLPTRRINSINDGALFLEHALIQAHLRAFTTDKAKVVLNDDGVVVVEGDGCSFETSRLSGDSADDLLFLANHLVCRLGLNLDVELVEVIDGKRVRHELGANFMPDTFDPEVYA